MVNTHNCRSLAVCQSITDMSYNALQVNGQKAKVQSHRVAQLSL